MKRSYNPEVETWIQIQFCLDYLRYLDCYLNGILPKEYDFVQTFSLIDLSHTVICLQEADGETSG